MPTQIEIEPTPLPAEDAEKRPRASIAVALVAVLALIIGVAIGALGERVKPAPAAPAVEISGTWLAGSNFAPTAVAWYQDGSHEYVPFNEAWRAPRQLRLLTAAAEVQCKIRINGKTVNEDRATGGHYALCSWLAE